MDEKKDKGKKEEASGSTQNTTPQKKVTMLDVLKSVDGNPSKSVYIGSRKAEELTNPALKLKDNRDKSGKK